VSLRLASVNLFSGRSLRDGLVDHDRVTSGLAALDADVVALQEVDRGQARSGGADQTAVAAAALGGGTAHRFVPLVAGTPGEPGWTAADPTGPPPSGPAYGIALLSRRPVASWHVLALEPPRGRWPMPVPTRPPRLLWIKDEPRAAVVAVLAEPRLVVACTHLSFVPGINVRQLRRVRGWLAALAERESAPLVLLGDLNLPGGLPARLTGWTPLVTGATYPAPAPRIQVDHALAHGFATGVAPGLATGLATGADGRVVALPFSDHRAVIVDLPSM